MHSTELRSGRDCRAAVSCIAMVLLAVLGAPSQAVALPLIFAEAVVASSEASSQPPSVVHPPPRRIPRKPPPPPAATRQSSEDSPAAEAEQQPGFVQRSIAGALAGRDMVGRSWVGFSREVDNFFAGDVRVIDDNKSYLRLSMEATFLEAGEHESDVRVKARVDLPNTKQRFRLIFESDDRTDDTLEERVRPVATGERVNNDQSLAGLELLTQLTAGWEASTSAGVRLSSGFNPYGRAKLERDFNWGQYWVGNFEQKVQYFDDSGWRESTELEFVRPIDDATYFNTYTEAEYRDEDNRFEFVQILALNHQLDERSSVSYRTGVFGASQPNPRTTGYFVGLSYRKSVHEDWVFLSITPELFYPRSEGWSVEPSINFELEMYFADD